MEGKITDMKNSRYPRETEMKFNKEYWGKTGRQPKKKKENDTKKK